MSVAVRCVSVAVDSADRPFYSLMRLSGRVGFECDDSGDVWIHFALPQEWFEV